MKYRKEEKHNLQWHTYTDHLRDMLHEMMKSNELTDVTLISDDQRQFKAHKIVLSACSAVFKEIIKDLPHVNSVIYLRGINHEEVEFILHYMYLGEATFYKERMNELLNVAKNLKIKDLHIGSEYDEEWGTLDTQNKEVLIKDELYTQDKEVEEDRMLMLQERNEIFLCKHCDYQATKKGTLKKHNESQHEGVKYACNQCPYQASQASNLNVHKQSVHGLKRFLCDYCDFKSSRKDNLRVHVESQHEGVKYACSQCPYQAKQQTHLIEHKRRIHEGLKRRRPQFGCKMCDYRTTNKEYLKDHTQSKHESSQLNGQEKFPCNQCDFQSHRKYYLTTHIKAKHNGVKFSCDQCSFQAKWQSNLKAHIHTVHDGIRFPCNYCSFTSTRRRLLKTHMLLKHVTVIQNLAHVISSSN